MDGIEEDLASGRATHKQNPQAVSAVPVSIPDAVRKLIDLVGENERLVLPEVVQSVRALEVLLPPSPKEPLQSTVFYKSDFGPLGQISIILPVCNGGDEDFDKDFDEVMTLVRSVMSRRQKARAKAIEAETAETSDEDNGPEASHE